MRRCCLILFLAALGATSLPAQSPPPDNRYVMRAQAVYLTGYPYGPRTAKGDSGTRSRNALCRIRFPALPLLLGKSK